MNWYGYFAISYTQLGNNHSFIHSFIYLFIYYHLLHLDSDEYVKKNVATLIREIAKHTPEVNAMALTRYVQLNIRIT